MRVRSTICQDLQKELQWGLKKNCRKPRKSISRLWIPLCQDSLPPPPQWCSCAGLTFTEFVLSGYTCVCLSLHASPLHSCSSYCTSENTESNSATSQRLWGAHTLQDYCGTLSSVNAGGAPGCWLVLAFPTHPMRLHPRSTDQCLFEQGQKERNNTITVANQYPHCSLSS